MKNKFAILAAALISVSAFAQKDELKTLKKIYEKEAPSEKDIVEYKATVAKAEPFLTSGSESDKVYLNFYKAAAPGIEITNFLSKPENQSNMIGASKFLSPDKFSEYATASKAVIDFEKKSGKQIHTKSIQENAAAVAPLILNYAQKLGSEKKYKDTSLVLYSLYQIDPSQPDNLYYAANYAVNAQDFDLALKYYDELKAIKYSGEGTLYMATSIANDKEESFATKEDRDKMVTMKTHVKPRDEKIPSKRGEIYKNIALILVQKGKTAEAKSAIEEAKKENPDDSSLLLTEADMYLSLKDYDSYKRIVAQVLEKNPNNADLVYNMGVMSLQAEQLKEAEDYFTKTIAIDPNYVNAYLNLSAIKFKADKKLVDEMNSLTTSEKDNKKYASLKAQREALFKSALPNLEKAHSLAPDNQDVIDNLLSVYSFLEMTDKRNALKAQQKK